MDINNLGPPDDYGPKYGAKGNSGLVVGYAWATWYSDDYDNEGVNISVHWKPAVNSKTEPAFEIVRWTKKGGRIE